MVFIHPTPKPALKTALAVLRVAFDGVAPVSANMPKRLVPQFVVVERAGGSRPNLVTDAARILIHCFALSPEVAESMCATVDEAMHNSIGTVVDSVFVRGWDNVTGGMSRPHPDVLSMERWQMNGDFMLSTSTPGS